MAFAQSVLPVDAVGDLVRSRFGLRVTAVELVRSLVNDVYAIETADARYACKVYRQVTAPRAWSRAEIGWEQQLAVQLLSSGLAVPAPVALVDGGLVGELSSPEGVRPYALTRWLTGAKPQPPWTDDLYRSFGLLTAQFHSAAATGVSRLPRRSVDPIEELAATAAEVVAALPDQDDVPDPDDMPDQDDATDQDDRVLVGRAAVRAGRQLNRLVTEGMTWGIRHGDVTLDNVLVAGAALSLHDFDRSGPGWLAADLTGVRATDHWDAFQHGYAELRTLSPADQQAMPALEVVALIANLRFHLVEKPRLSDPDARLGSTEALLDEGGWIERELTRLRVLSPP